jgi:hypothetical protein
MPRLGRSIESPEPSKASAFKAILVTLSIVLCGCFLWAIVTDFTALRDARAQADRQASHAYADHLSAPVVERGDAKTYSNLQIEVWEGRYMRCVTVRESVSCAGGFNYKGPMRKMEQ